MIATEMIDLIVTNVLRSLIIGAMRFQHWTIPTKLLKRGQAKRGKEPGHDDAKRKIPLGINVLQSRRGKALS
jgi:hypothetical protein